jgi:hypothetical protein
MAYGFIHWTPTPGKCSPHTSTSENLDSTAVKYSNFFYGVGPRFHPLLKAELSEMTSIYDFISEDEAATVKEFKNISVILIEHEKQSDTREYGVSTKFNENQIALLQSLEYSSNFNIRGEYEGIDPYTGKMANLHFGPHYTVVPEKQTKYLPGDTALINYFTSGNKENTGNLDEKRLRPAKLYFVVSKTGKISNIRLHNHSGYKKIDETMIKLLQQLPGEWLPAENAKGEKVDQELVISFGLVGC